MKDNKSTQKKQIIFPNKSLFLTLKDNLWQLLFILLVSIVIYYQCTDFGYILDDKIVITDNNFTKKGFSGISDILTTESMTGYFGEQKNLVQGNRYRPLSLVTFALEYEFFKGLNPQFSHWINIFLYGLTGVLMYLLLLLFLKSKQNQIREIKWFSLAVAFIFVTHPIHVEAVANIKGRDEIMAFLFALLSLRYAFKYNVQGSWGKLLVANFLFLLGLLSKENTITFLAIFPLSFYFFSDTSLIKSLKKTWTFLITTCMYLIWRFSVSGVPKFGLESQDLMNNPFLGMSMIERTATILYTLGWYIKLLFVPYPLTHDYYPYTIPKMDFSGIEVWISLAIYMTFIVYALINFSKKQMSGFAILFYLITLTIVSNIVFNLGTFMNDRFVYISSFGFVLLLTFSIYKFSFRSFKKPLILFLTLISSLGLTYTGLSMIRVPDWESALSLNKSALRVSSNSARANTFMATAIFQDAKDQPDLKKKKSLMQEAFPYAKKSVEIYPTYYNGNLMLAGIAAEIHKIDGHIDPLIETFERVIKIRPDISFVSEYLNYLNERGRDQYKISEMCKRAGRGLIDRNEDKDLRWALHYLNLAYQYNEQDVEVNQLIAQVYQLMGDLNSANQFNSRANGLKNQ
jgi:tetratricopeptide (TPR) repeat protein